MAKFIRKPLSRGAELSHKHCTEIETIQADIADGGLEVENLEHKMSPFSVNLNFPWVDSKYFYDNDPKGNMPFYTSFCLPPLQEHFNNNPYQSSLGSHAHSDNPVPVLESISLSFDQRDTSGATVSQWYGTNKIELAGGSPAANTHYQFPDAHTQWEPNPQEGFLTFMRAEGLNLKLVIYSKPQTFFDAMHVGSAVNISAISAADPPEITTSAAHGLEVGDRVLIQKSATSPVNIAGEHIVIDKADSTHFKVDVDASSATVVNSGTATKIQRSGNTTSAVATEVYSQVFPAAALAGGVNPILGSGLNIAFNPYHTYVAALYAPDLHDSRSAFDADIQVPKWEFPHAKGLTGAQEYRFSQHLALLSLWINLNFKMQLNVRDAQGGSDTLIQNLPQHDGTKSETSFSTSAPVAGDPVSADDSSKGISTRIESLDKIVQDKLKGGFSSFFSELHDYETLQDDSGYEIIAVPMMQGFPHGQLTVRDLEHLPYTTLDLDSRFYDRRLIPIPHNLHVHHVVACLNFTGHKVEATQTSGSTTVAPFDDVPASPRAASVITYDGVKMPRVWNGKPLYNYEVGVGMIQGPASDNLDYQQIAYVDFEYTRERASPYGSPFLIDVVDLGLGALYPGEADGSYDKFFEQALISVPLVGTGATGTGYFNNDSGVAGAVEKLFQGKKIFVGGTTSAQASDTGTPNRSGIGDGGGSMGPSATKGQEQFLEVRMAVRPRARLSISGAAASGDLITTSAAHYLKEDDAVLVLGTSQPAAAAPPSMTIDGNVFYVQSTSLTETTFKIKTAPGSLGTDVEFGGTTGAAGTITVLGQHNDIVMGYGGNFVYLICKKQLRA